MAFSAPTAGSVNCCTIIRKAPAGQISAHRPQRSHWPRSTREGESKSIAAWGQAGYHAVDLETATVYAVARHFNVPAVALLFAFDCLADGEHMVLTDRAKAQRRAQGEVLMVETALKLASL